MYAWPKQPNRYNDWLWLIPAAAGFCLTALIVFILPPDRTLDTLFDFVFKLLPLILGVVTIALFPQRNHWVRWLLLLGFLFYMGYIDSAYMIQIDRLIEARLAGQWQTQFPAFYTFNLFVNTFTIFLALLAYRLGGGSAAHVVKLGCAAILVMISGLNDLTMWWMYPWPQGERPFVFDWASHVAVLIGHTPNLYDMVAFLSVHLLLAVLVMRLPLHRWLGRIGSDRSDEARTGHP